MSSSARARAQPQGRSRAKPGAKGGGEFYHVQVRAKTFRTQDVGEEGCNERVTGKRSTGSFNDAQRAGSGAAEAK